MELRSRLLPQAKVATLYMLSIVIPEHAEHTDASASVGYVTSQIVPPIIQYVSAVGGYIAKAKIPSIFWLFLGWIASMVAFPSSVFLTGCNNR